MSGKRDVWKHSALTCVQCGAALNAAGGLGKEQPPPEDGDFTICIKCGGAMRYRFKEEHGKKLARLEPVTEADLLEMDTEQMREFAQMQTFVMASLGLKPRPGNKLIRADDFTRKQ